MLVLTVHYKQETLAAQKVVSPQLTDLSLASDVPDGEADVLYGADGLHIESYGGDRGDSLTQLQLVEQGRLACAVQAQEQYLAVLAARERLVEVLEFRHYESHDENDGNVYSS